MIHRTTGVSVPLGPIEPHRSDEHEAEIARDAESEVVRIRPAGGDGALALTRLFGREVEGRAARLRLQARLERVAALRHPGLVVPQALDWKGGEARIAARWVEGERLDDWARSERRTTRAVLALFRQLCDALLAAHAAGLVHGGLGAGKVLVDAEGRPHVLGLGYRKDLTVESARYTAPELVLEQRLAADERGEDPRMDVCSLGTLLFELLTGHNPWEHVADLAALREAFAAGEAPRPSSLRFRVGRELDALVHQATVRDREERYVSVTELAEDVGRLIAGQRVRARPPRRWYLFRSLEAKD